jgi:hypothetical protein
MRKLFVATSFIFFSLVLTSGCAPSSKSPVSGVSVTVEDQAEIRQMQIRAFDTTNKEKMLRMVIATLQDLGFVIDGADHQLGSVGATKLDNYQHRITVTVRRYGEMQLIVRANAQAYSEVVEDPKPYQDFFASLSKAAFLEARPVQ